MVMKIRNNRLCRSCCRGDLRVFLLHFKSKLFQLYVFHDLAEIIPQYQAYSARFGVISLFW